MSDKIQEIRERVKRHRQTEHYTDYSNQYRFASDVEYLLGELDKAEIEAETQKQIRYNVESVRQAPYRALQQHAKELFEENEVLRQQLDSAKQEAEMYKSNYTHLHNSYNELSQESESYNINCQFKDEIISQQRELIFKLRSEIDELFKNREEWREHSRHLETERASLIRKLEQAAETLEWYANEENYRRSEEEYHQGYPQEIMWDKGIKAREALSLIREGEQK